MECPYKLVMFGFSALCESLEEVEERLKIYPTQRALSENGEECYLIDLNEGSQIPIVIQNNSFVLDMEHKIIF